jgi:hypothetical protein
VALVATASTGVAAVFAILGKPALAAVSGGVALVGAVITVMFGVPLALSKRRREEAKRHKQMLGDGILPIEKVDPIAIGVDPAARENPGLDIVPEYVPRRAADRELHDALREALDVDEDGKGRWIVVVYGMSKVGKSRTLYEGLLHLAKEGEDLRLVAPADGDAVRTLLEQVGRPHGKRSRLVLWLDDLETFMADGVGYEDLQAWHQKGAIVVATYGGKGSRRAGATPEWIDALPENKVMLHARQIGLQPTTPSELEDLPESLSAVDREAIAEYGLAAALVAAPMLRLKLKAPGQTSAAGPAIVYTAINWARCGRTDPISKEQLRELWPGHSRDEAPHTNKAFKQGLAWALKPVSGRIALLKGRDAFRPYDYIRDFATTDPDTPPISEETWRQALDTEDPGQAFGVGVAAHAAGRRQDAERALSFASEHDDGEIGSAASFNPGLVLEGRGESPVRPRACAPVSRSS